MIAWMLWLACGAPTEEVAWKHFGAPFAVAEAVPASAVLVDPDGHAGKPVRMQGQLAEVCQKKGCWAVVQDDQGHAIRITMKDHAFGIDKDTAGRACDVEGSTCTTTIATSRHTTTGRRVWLTDCAGCCA